MSNAPTDYAVAQKVVHWLMSLLIILDLFVAQKFGDFMEDWDRFESRSDHATIGMIVTLLLVIRLLLRWRYGAPPLPSAMPDWQVKLARTGHTLMYFCLALLVVSGIATAINANSDITVFGSLSLSIGQVTDEPFNTLRPIHEFATNAIIALIVIHLFAALYHQFVIKDRTLINMLTFWRRQTTEEPST